MLGPNLAQFFLPLRDGEKKTRSKNFVVYYFVRGCACACVGARAFFLFVSATEWISFGCSLSVCVRTFKCRGGCCCCVSVEMHAWCTLIRFDWIFRNGISGEIFTHAAMHLSRTPSIQIARHTCFYRVNRDKFRSRVSCCALHLIRRVFFLSRFISLTVEFVRHRLWDLCKCCKTAVFLCIAMHTIRAGALHFFVLRGVIVLASSSSDHRFLLSGDNKIWANFMFANTHTQQSDSKQATVSHIERRECISKTIIYFVRCSHRTNASDELTEATERLRVQTRDESKRKFQVFFGAQTRIAQAFFNAYA